MHNSDNSMITIEYQDSTGNWRMHSITQNLPAKILLEMKSASTAHNNARARAVDKTGHIVDILWGFNEYKSK